jgi:hypothetical protein
MSWFDDPDLEAAFDDLPSEESNAASSMVFADYDLPEVGHIVGGRYRVERCLSPGRCFVRHTRLDHGFLLRLLPGLFPGSPIQERLAYVTEVAGLLNNDRLGFVAEIGVCPRFGGFAICEWVEGVSLSEILLSTAVPQFELEEALGFMVDLGGVLAELHDVGISHGMLDGSDIVRDRAGRWKLLAPGLPAEKIDIGPAPHVDSQMDATPGGDQWSLAYGVYALLVGEVPEGESPISPSDFRVDIPRSLDDVLLRALDHHVSRQWPSTEDFVSAFQTAVVQWRAGVGLSEPISSLDSLFSVPTDGEAQGGFARSRLAARSVVIEMLSEPMTINMNFQSMARLRTEYRNNIIAGGLYAPGVVGWLKGQDVLVTLQYEPTGQSITIPAMVAHESAGDSKGTGLVFEAKAHAEVLKFTAAVDPSADLKPNDALSAAIVLDKDSPVTAAEAFLLSRLSGPTQLGYLRAFFNGLPFDFEETAVGLIDRGLVTVARAAPSVTQAVNRSNVPSRAEPPIVSVQKEVVTPKPQVLVVSAQKGKTKATLRQVELSKDEVEIVLDKSTVFEGRGNYRAAVEILQNALAARIDARLLHRLAVVRAKFQGTYGRSMRELTRALALRPEDPDIRASQRWIQALIDTESVRSVWRQSIAGGSYRLLRVDSDINRAWIEVDASSAAERRIIGVDYVRAQVQSTVRAKDPRQYSAITGDHPSLSTPEVRLTSGDHATRSRQRKLAAVARNSNDYGPWFRKGPEPLLTTPDSRFLIFERHPITRDEGLYFIQENATMSALKLERDGTRGERPSITPDGAVAFSTTGPIQAVWVAELYQAARDIMPVQGPSTALWSGDGNDLFVLEHRTGVISKTDRKGSAPVKLAKVGACRGWFVDLDVSRVVCLSNDERKLTLLSLESGAVVGEMALDDRVTDVLLRNDGLVAAMTTAGLEFVDFGAGRRQVLPISVHPTSFAQNYWLPRNPLIVLAASPSSIELSAIDPGIFL